MPRIAILEGYGPFNGSHSGSETRRSNMARRKRRSGKAAQRAKFKRVAKICNKKKGKAARKACWRKHY